MADQLEAMARAICIACEENPDHQGDCMGNKYRWQDYLPVAEAALDSMPNGREYLEQYRIIDMSGGREAKHVAEIGRLKAELDALKHNNAYCPMCGSGTVPSVPNIESLYKLLEYADESDGAQYGTLSTSLVRDLVNEALVAPKPGEPK